MSAEAHGATAHARGWGGAALLAIVLVALLARLAVAMQYEARHPQAERPVIDEAAYDRWAREIAAGDWLGDEVFFQEPLYPYGMALLYRVLGGDRTAVRHAQAGLGALGALLVVLLGRRLFGSPAGELAGLLFALHGPALWLGCLLLKETTFATVLVGLALALVSARRPRGWLGVGVLAGLGALLRGNVLVLLPLLLLWPLGRVLFARAPRAPLGAALAACLACAAGVALVLAPVVARNRVVGGEWVLATSGAGTNLYGGNNAHNPQGRASEFPWVRGIPEHEADDWRREAERRVGRPLTSGETSAFWRDEVLRSVARDPWMHLGILWRKLRLTLGDYEVPDNHAYAWDREQVPLLALPWPGFGVVGLLGLAGLVLLALRRPAALGAAAAPRDARGALELALLAGLYLATVVLTVTSARVRFPLVPLLAPFAGHGLACAAAALRGRVAHPSRALGAYGLASGLAFLAVWTQRVPEEERRADRDERELNYAVQLLDEGRDDEARALLEPLRARHAQSARLAVLVALLDAREAERLDAGPGQADERARALAGRAEEELRAVLAHEELVPRERFRAAAALGWLLVGLGRPVEALEPLEQARAFDPDDAELALAQARALTRAGEEERVESESRRLLRAAREAARALPLAEDDPRAVLARSEADVALGRRLLDAGAEGPEAQLARELVRAGLAALEPLDESEEPELRARARRLAGLVQLWLGNAAAAERHLRVALGLRPRDAQARLALAHALAAQLDEAAGAPDEERAARRAELRALLADLRAAGVDEAVLAALRVRVEAGG